MRLKKLSDVQFTIVSHAMSCNVTHPNTFLFSELIFTHLIVPQMQCITYSTCSVHKEENECVVKRLLDIHKDWKLFPIFPKWKTRGIPVVTDSFENDPIAKYCIRTYPENDKTNGFFVSCFVRNMNKEPEVIDQLQQEQEQVQGKRKQRITGKRAVNPSRKQSILKRKKFQ